MTRDSTGATDRPKRHDDANAAYFHAREQGRTQEEAAQAAGRYMADVKHVAAL